MHFDNVELILVIYLSNYFKGISTTCTCKAPRINFNYIWRYISIFISFISLCKHNYGNVNVSCSVSTSQYLTFSNRAVATADRL